MSDMLKIFVETELARQIKENYPHMQYPSGVYGLIKDAIKTDTEYVYTLKILNRDYTQNNDFPEIPGVKSNIEFFQGDIVVLLMMYGGTEFVILGRNMK